jgi:glycosyltransferase involved in cell wall biosynthesis
MKHASTDTNDYPAQVINVTAVYNYFERTTGTISNYSCNNTDQGFHMHAISVAMATFNGERFIEEQLESIASQTVTPIELVISDDGSTDSTLSIVERFATRSKFPVRVLSPHARMGFSDNFLLAAESCSGDVIAFSDQDDVWLPSKLHEAVARLDADNSHLTMHRLTLTDSRLQPIGIINQGITEDAVFPPLSLNPFVTGWGNSFLFRRELLSLIPHAERPSQPWHANRPLSHDTWIYVLSASFFRTSHMTSQLINYRQHNANAVGVAVNTASGKNKLFDLLDTNLSAHRERHKFMREMHDVMSRYRNSFPSDMAIKAEAVIAMYNKRYEDESLIIAVYEEPSLFARLSAYRLLNSIGSDITIGSKLKRILIGVSGIGRLINSQTNSDQPAS